MTTHNKIYFDTIFGHTFQEGAKLNILIINIIKSEHGIIIDQKDHIINNTVQ